MHHVGITSYEICELYESLGIYSASWDAGTDQNLSFIYNDINLTPRSNSPSNMCSGDLFLAVLAIFFPPIAGKCIIEC